MCIIEFIRCNIDWIKDLFTILFTGTATVIAIMTYLRAKGTILQPMRSEVIKVQVKEISKILDFIASFNYSPKYIYDYFNLLKVNIDAYLFDHQNRPQSSKSKESLDEIGGWIIFTDKLDSVFVYVSGSHDEFIRTYLHDGKAKLQPIFEEEIEKLNVVFYTKTYIESYKKISDFVENPLLPVEMIKMLMKIKYDGKFNLILNLQDTVKSFAKQYRDLKQNNSIDENTLTALNRKAYVDFEKARFNHDSDVSLLKIYIRKFLRIDEKWI